MSLYLLNLGNFLDLTHIIMTPILVICNILKEPFIDPETQAYIGAIIAFSVITKAFDWLRLAESTAFFIVLIQNTWKDIAPFIALLFVALFMFAMPHHILASITEPTAEDLENPPRIWGSFYLLNSVVEQYQQNLDA